MFNFFKTGLLLKHAPLNPKDIQQGRSPLFRGLRWSLEKRRIGVKLKMNQSVLIFKKKELSGYKRKSKIF
jgi:hypothetical protein